MLAVIPDVLNPDELATIRKRLQPQHFSDGKLTAGGRARGVKRNLQTDVKGKATEELQELVLRALARSSAFGAIAAPRHVLKPRFNLYKEGMYYGDHVDNAIMGGRLLANQAEGDRDPVRVDMSFTLFISEPQSYGGGELVIKTGFGVHPFKLPAGHMILYPTLYFHEVTPVTSGERLACVSWLQSMIRSLGHREILFDLAMLAQGLTKSAPPRDQELDLLDKVRKNLLRMWAEN